MAVKPTCDNSLKSSMDRFWLKDESNQFLLHQLRTTLTSRVGWIYSIAKNYLPVMLSYTPIFIKSL